MRKLTKVLFEIAAVLFVAALVVFLLGGLGEYYFDQVLKMDIRSVSAGIASIMLVTALIALIVSVAVLLKGGKTGRHRTNHPIPH
jgi:uncharacterized membrane protein YtjA (UPF0391 family)